MSSVDLVSVAREFRKGIIGDKAGNDMCFAVCSPLVTLLQMEGVQVELTCGEVRFGAADDFDHYWISLPDGRILDPTADQFGLASVYLGPLPENYSAYPVPA